MTINITISSTEQISNIILMIGKKFQSTHYDINEYKKSVKIALKERNYNNDIINEWVNCIE